MKKERRNWPKTERRQEVKTALNITLSDLHSIKIEARTICEKITEIEEKLFKITDDAKCIACPFKSL